MKIKKLLAAVLATVALPTVACAAPAPAAALPDADPALWVVKDADTTVYLFGTFHALDGKTDWFNDEVKVAFDKSSEVYLEAILPDNPAEMQPMVMKYGLDPSGKKLSAKLTPELKAKFERQEISCVAIRIFKPDGSWEDRVIGGEESDRAAALADLQDVNRRSS